MRFRTPAPTPQRETTIPLINVVFLLLIFVLLAGTLRIIDENRAVPPFASAAEGMLPTGPGVVYLHREGGLSHDGVAIDIIDLPQRLIEMQVEPETIWLVADRGAPATLLIDVTAAITDAGVAPVRLVTLNDDR